jgi:hypothetical protein
LWAAQPYLLIAPVNVEWGVPHRTLGDALTEFAELERKRELCRLNSFNVVNKDQVSFPCHKRWSVLQQNTAWIAPL